MDSMMSRTGFGGGRVREGVVRDFEGVLLVFDAVEPLFFGTATPFTDQVFKLDAESFGMREPTLPAKEVLSDIGLGHIGAEGRANRNSSDGAHQLFVKA